MKLLHHTLNILGFLICMGLFIALIIKEQFDSFSSGVVCFIFSYLLTRHFIKVHSKIEMYDLPKYIDE